jgi:large subunit ribosomal protein L10e
MFPAVTTGKSPGSLYGCWKNKPYPKPRFCRGDPDATSLTWVGKRRRWMSSHSEAPEAAAFAPSTWWRVAARVAFTSLPCHGITETLSCAGTYRPQTGMRGAFGKPQGIVARAHVGQVLPSIRTKLQSQERVIKALSGAMFVSWSPEHLYLPEVGLYQVQCRRTGREGGCEASPPWSLCSRMRTIGSRELCSPEALGSAAPGTMPACSSVLLTGTPWTFVLRLWFKEHSSRCYNRYYNRQCFRVHTECFSEERYFPCLNKKNLGAIYGEKYCYSNANTSDSSKKKKVKRFIQ